MKRTISRGSDGGRGGFRIGDVVAGGVSQAGVKWDPFAAWKRGRMEANRSNDRAQGEGAQGESRVQQGGGVTDQDGESNKAPARGFEGEGDRDNRTPLVEDGLLDAHHDGDSEPPKTARVNNTVKPSEYMRAFLNRWAVPALLGLLGREQCPVDAMSCKACKEPTTTSPTRYRCCDCHNAPVLCKACVLSSHAHNPFHFVAEWDIKRGFWKRQPLSNLGVVLDLGHDGDRCVYASGTPRPMCIVSEHGVHEIGVRFCGCLDKTTRSTTPDVTQLLQQGLWPASWEQPRTAFTIGVMKTFSLLSHQGNMNAYDYVEVLRRKTDGTITEGTVDRYREFLIANRTFSYVTAAKRHGQQPGSLSYAALAILCPACPQTDMNMDPKWKNRTEELRFLDALYYSIDGNFHANLKDKPFDKDDVPLTKGAGYFADEDLFSAYTAKLGPLQPEPSTCHKFVAMGLGPYWGRVSGTVGLFCARHMFVLPGGHVDLQKGERFSNVDFAVSFGLRRWMDLLMHVAAYDVQCQYRLKFKTRMASMWKILSRLDKCKILKGNDRKLFPWTIAGVGKFHLAGHRADCRYRWSFNFLPYSAMMDGEAPERIWSVTNPLSNRTREMNPGHRHDIMNEFYSDQNVRRTHNISTSLDRKHRTAQEYLPPVAKALDTLETSIINQYGKKKLETLKEKEAAFKIRVVDHEKHAGLENPYDLPAPSAKTRAQLEQEIGSQAHATSSGVDLISFIEQGIELQEQRACLLQRAAAADGDVVVESEVETFLSSHSKWQQIHETTLSPMLAQAQKEADVADGVLPETLNTPTDEGNNESNISSHTAGQKRKRASHGHRTEEPTSRQWSKINNTDVLLPSSYVPVVRDQQCLQLAVQVELELRKARAADSLDLLRTHLITSYTFEHNAKKQAPSGATGHKAITRNKSAAFRKRDDVNLAADSYRRAYNALVALGLQNSPDFRKLDPKDVRPFVVRTSDQQLGDSKSQPSWIWQKLQFLNTKDVTRSFHKYAEQVIEVHWFRMSALKSRWEEEAHVVVEEMKRTVRFFKFQQDHWLQEGDKHEDCNSLGHAAYARKQAYRYERLVAKCGEDFANVKEVEIDNIHHSRNDGWLYMFNREKHRYVEYMSTDID